MDILVLKCHHFIRAFSNAQLILEATSNNKPLKENNVVIVFLCSLNSGIRKVISLRINQAKSSQYLFLG